MASLRDLDPKEQEEALLIIKEAQSALADEGLTGMPATASAVLESGREVSFSWDGALDVSGGDFAPPRGSAPRPGPRPRA